MHILPVTTGLLERGDDLVRSILQHGSPVRGDIIVISSKAVARTESGPTDLRTLVASPEAKEYAKRCGQEPAFTEFVLRETTRMQGHVVAVRPYALLTSLKPKGMNVGRILCPNAGADRSNTEAGTAIGWPHDAAASAKKIFDAFREKGVSVGVIISDSCCQPGRLGVTAFALAAAGFEPVQSNIGTPDLFGSPLKITNEAIADQLATAANSVMGNAAQGTAAAIVRGHGIHPSDFCGWVHGIEPEDDLFRGAM